MRSTFMISLLRNPFDPRALFPSAPNGASGSPATERRSASGDGALPPLQAVEAPSSWHEPTVSDDDVRRSETSRQALQREGADSSLNLGGCVDESEPSFHMSESALARLEAGLRAQEKKQAPPAGQLPPVFGLRAADSEGSNEGSRQTCSRLSFQPSPPLAPERLLPQAPKQRRSALDVTPFVLIAGAIAVTVAYYVSTG